MADPVERLKLFVEDRRQQERSVQAQECWLRKLPELLPSVDAVVDVMRHSLLPDQFAGEPVAVLCDPRREQFPLVIAFGPRATEATTPEIGASVVFRCEADGRVHGYRYPFHNVTKTWDPQRFVDLGEPECLTADCLGNAVAEFLEWASAGEGCGDSRLQFEVTPTLPFVRPAVKLTMIAA